MAPSPPPPTLTGPEGSAWAPLRNRRFALLWAIWVGANICSWMTEVTAAWLMTSLTSSALMVSLVQTASTLPVFLLSLPGGALADQVNRRNALIAAQTWLAVVAGLVVTLAQAGRLTPWWLLALTFASGMAAAVRWPVFTALVPEVVSRSQLAPAMTLHAMAVNTARVLGPVLAGLAVAAAGTTSVFAAVCVLSLVSAGLLARWAYAPSARPEPRPALGPAIMAGLRHVLGRHRMRAVLVQSALVYMAVTTLLALLPLVAQSLRPGDASLYVNLAASAGLGAVFAGPLLHRLRRRYATQALVTGAMLVLAAAIAGVALARHPTLVAGLLFLAGGSWLATGNTLNVTLQRELTDDLRARGMSIFLMTVMAGGALGSAVFGTVADLTGVHGALLAMAAKVVAGALTLKSRWPIDEPSA